MKSSTKKTRKSRPRARAIGKLIGCRWHDPKLAAIDAWRRKEHDLPSRSEAIRRLVELGLMAEKRKGRK